MSDQERELDSVVVFVCPCVQPGIDELVLVFEDDRKYRVMRLLAWRTKDPCEKEIRCSSDGRPVVPYQLDVDQVLIGPVIRFEHHIIQANCWLTAFTRANNCDCVREWVSRINEEEQSERWKQHGRIELSVGGQAVPRPAREWRNHTYRVREESAD